MFSRQQYGRKGERKAANHLRRSGYRILEKNYRCLYGEIDIIARQKDTLVFVEVKARSTDRFGDGKAAVSRSKQRKISQVALHYLKTHRHLDQKARFDVVAICGAGADMTIDWVRNAFELAYP